MVTAIKGGARDKREQLKAAVARAKVASPCAHCGVLTYHKYCGQSCISEARKARLCPTRTVIAGGVGAALTALEAVLQPLEAGTSYGERISDETLG